MKIFDSQRIVQTTQDGAGDTPRASTSEYAEENGSFFKHAIILVSR
jgi:hypothetical protein